MTAVVATRSGTRDNTPPRGMLHRLDATGIIQVYIIVLMTIPSRLVLKPLGALGTPSTLIALLAFLVWFIGAFAADSAGERRVIVVRLLLVQLWTVVLVSYAVMNRRSVLGPELRNSDRFIISLIGWSGVALLTAEGVRNSVDLYRVLRAVTTGAAILATTAVFQFYTGFDFARQVVAKIPALVTNGDQTALLRNADYAARGGFNRPSGTAVHPIEMSAVVTMCLPIAVHMALYDLRTTRWRRWFPVVALALAVPLALSRSALLGAVVAGAFFFAGATPRLRLKALGAIGGLGIVAFMTAPGLLGTLRSLVLPSQSDTSISTRTEDYAVAAKYVGNSPFIGRGPATFLPSYRFLDNQYLLSAIEIGLVGVVSIFAYLAGAAFLGRSLRQHSCDPKTRDLGQALAGASGVAVVTSAAFDSLSFVMFAGLIPILIGVAGAARAMLADGELA